MQLSEKIREIEVDRSSGASQIARNALGVLRLFAQTSENQTYSGFVEDFGKVGRQLFDARANMASVQNLVAQIVYEVNSLKEHDLVSVQKFATSRIDELCKQSEEAVKKSAERAAAIIDDSICLASCSYSSTVCETFRLAKQQGKSFDVLVAESKAGDFRYGEMAAKFLESINVPVEVFPDNQVWNFVRKAEYVLVGADSVLSDGSIINGTPTCEVAVKANDSGVPFYCVCETAKANVLSFLGKNIEVKSGFDAVPADMVSGIFTEKGMLGTNRITEIMKDYSKFFEVFNPIRQS